MGESGDGLERDDYELCAEVLSNGAFMLEVNDFLEPKSILLITRDSGEAGKIHKQYLAQWKWLATGEDDELLLHSQFPPLNLGDKVVLPVATKANIKSKVEQGMDQ